jgi:hypothetical protein
MFRVLGLRVRIATGKGCNSFHVVPLMIIDDEKAIYELKVNASSSFI